MQPAPTGQHRAAVQAAAKHGAFVVDVGVQRQVQTQLPIMPGNHFEAHFTGQRNVVMKDGFQITTVAVHARILFRSIKFIGVRVAAALEVQPVLAQFVVQGFARHAQRFGEAAHRAV